MTRTSVGISRRNALDIRSLFAVVTLVVSVLALAPTSAEAQTQVHTGDADALLAFRDASMDGATTWGSTWDRNTAFGTAGFQGWRYVTANAQGRVIRLDFEGESGASVKGTIPAVLGNLSELEALRLVKHPELTGTIPAELGGLSKLKELQLSQNKLSGPIPTALGNLSALERLSLAENELTGTIPAELGTLSNLGTLILSVNKLTCPIPTALNALSGLKTLQLRNNELNCSIPPVLSTLRGLEELSLEDNQLTGPIPATWINLVALRKLGLSGNPLSSPIPAALGSLSTLQELALVNSQLTGPIPPEIGNLAGLDSLLLNDNQLTGPIPPEIGNLAGLDFLRLDNNQLTGPIPPEIGSLAGLDFLRLDNNQLTGPIPPEIGNLSELAELYLDVNQLSGDIPLELAKLDDNNPILRILKINGNSGLTGCVPPTLMLRRGRTTVEIGHLEFCTSPESHRAALVALYMATSGDTTWIKKDNWNTDEPISTWYGVTTNARGQVIGLDLGNNDLRGELPRTALDVLADTLTDFDLEANGGLLGCLPYSLRHAFKTVASRNSRPFCGPTGRAEMIAEVIAGARGRYIVTAGGGLIIDATMWSPTGTRSRAQFGLSGSLPMDLTLALSPVTTPPDDPSEDKFMLGEVETDRTTLVDIRTEGRVPSGGLEVCLPVTAGLLDEAGNNRQMRVLRHDGMNWQEAGSRWSVEEDLVCASGVTDFSPFAVGYALPDEKARDVALVLAGVARTLASDAVDVIGGRFNASPAGGGHMMLAGQVLSLTDAPSSTGANSGNQPWQQLTGVALGVARAFGLSLNTGGLGTGVGSGSLPPLCKGRLGGVESPECHQTSSQWAPGIGLGQPAGNFGSNGFDNFITLNPISVNDVLARSAFELPLSSTGDNGMPAWTLWGRGSASGFSGSPEADFNMDGTLYSGYIGLDHRPSSSLLLGLAVSHSSGTIDYERTGSTEAEVGLKLTSVLPYAHWQPRPGLGVWGMFGAGVGTIDHEGTDRGGALLPRSSTDLTSVMGAIGGQQALTTWEGIDLSAKTDAFASTLRAEEATDLPSARGHAQRIRLLFEGRTDMQVDAVSRLVPRLAFGGRWDSGTAEQGFGAELNGGLAYTHTALGLSVEAQGRYLLAHEADAFDDWGASLNVRLDPGQMGQGASLTIAPVWGQAVGNVDQLWDNTQMLGQVAGAAGSNTATPGTTTWMPQQLEVAFGYGLPLTENQGLLTPYGGLTMVGPGASRYRLGSSLAMDSSLNLTLELTHTDQPAQSAIHGITTRLNWQW